jgi:hypothetical protein
MAHDQSPLTRLTRLALELVDPITGAIVSRGVTVEARKSNDRPSGIAPVVNLSGRFVWLERSLPPVPEIARIACDPGRLPYKQEVIDLSDIPEGQKLVSRRLRPNAAYIVPQGVTAMRGTLFELEDGKRKPIKDAVVQIAWLLSQPVEWIPPPPATLANLRVGDAVTDENGDFLAFSRPLKNDTRYSDYVGYPKPDEPGFRRTRCTPDSRNGVAKARLQVTRFDIGQWRWTDTDFEFFKTLPKGSIAEGQMPPRDLELDWDELSN